MMLSIPFTMLLTLLVVPARAESSYEIFDWQQDGQQQLLRGSERRLQARGEGSLWCRYLMVDTLYLTDREEDTVEELCCAPIVDNKELDDVICDAALANALPFELKRTHKEEIERGTLIVEHFGAKILDDKTRIEFSKNPIFRVHVNPPDHLRRLQTKNLDIKSEMTVAIVRVTVSNASNKYSTTTIRNTLSGNGVNFLTQYNACSHGKLKWKLANNGIIDVKVNKPISNFQNGASLVTAAQTAMKDTMGINSVADLADKVIMCLPPGTGNWAASAGVNHWRAQMNNDWCLSLTGTMHELGHTMGLLHSNANGKAYADRSGYMGSGYTETEWPQKCFNGYNSYIFGWYRDHHLDWNVVKDGDRLIDIATFVDYKQASGNEYIIVNLVDTYFLLYNKAKDFNIDTEQKVDQVTITQPVSGGTDSKAGLSVGDKFEVPNFQNSKKKLVVEACKTKKGENGADVMVVSVALDKSLCGQHSSSVSSGVGSGKGRSGSNNAFLSFIDLLRSSSKKTNEEAAQQSGS
jgi:hypothetical protein